MPPRSATTGNGHATGTLHPVNAPPAESVPVVSVEARQLTIVVPLAPADGPNQHRYIPETLTGGDDSRQVSISPAQGRILLRLRDALEAGHVRFGNGALVVPDLKANYPRTIRWLLEQVFEAAAQADAPQQNAGK